MRRNRPPLLMPFALAGFVIGSLVSVQSSAQSLQNNLEASGKAPFERPSGFDERETVVARAPTQAVAYPLQAGMTVLDLEAAPTGGEVALVIETAAHRQQLAFWRFDGGKLHRSLDIPSATRIASVTWHPQGTALFLLATGPAGSKVLKLDPSSSRFAPKVIFESPRRLRRLMVGPRPFQTGGASPDHRLFFAEQLASGAYALRSVTENGEKAYTVAGPDSKLDDPKLSPAFPPNLAVSLSASPVAFHPAGNRLIWEDEKKCLHRMPYVLDNWGDATPFDAECGGMAAYTPNGAATLEWRPDSAGLRLRGLIDKTDRRILTDHKFAAPPSQTPDGRGVVALTRNGARTTLRYEPIDVPLADVANAWMYLENNADQEKFVRHGGLFRTLAVYEQIYQLYDSESYTCGAPDTRKPTRPYLVTTDLFWEVYGAAFNGLFIVLEREKAMPAFKNFLRATAADLAKKHADTKLAKAFAAALAVLEGDEARNEEAQLILASHGQAQSPALETLVDYGEFKPRGHYKTADQRRYFAAMRYLSQITLTDDDVAQLRGLEPAVAKTAQEWIGGYAPFIASTRVDLVWGDGRGKSTVASHPGPPGARIFPLSWGWDNEALDNTVHHDAWPPPEQMIAVDGAPRLLPSGLDFAAVAGNALALELLKQSGALAKYPNLAARIKATADRLKAGSGHGALSLYEQWLAGLGVQWADAASGPIAGALWDAKRLQTGLASWATLRHATVLVNDKTDAECGEGGFEPIVLRPPRGYVEPDPASFEAIAGLFDATIKMVQAGSIDPRLRDGIVRRLTESRDDARRYGRIANKEVNGEPITSEEYQAIQYVGGAVEHNFLVFMSLSNPGYALSLPDPMMKVADVAGGPGSGGHLEAAVGRPLEWDQIVPFYGRRQIVKGAVYAYHEFTTPEPIDDEQWRSRVDREAPLSWIARYLSNATLSCPALQP